MSVTHTSFDELIVGSPLHIERSIKLSPGSGTLEKGWLTVKENPQQDDSEALIKKSITTSPSADGAITDPGGSGVGQFVFHLLSIDTGKLKHRVVYYIDIWIKTTLDEPTGTETGRIVPHFAVTLERT